MNRLLRQHDIKLTQLQKEREMARLAEELKKQFDHGVISEIHEAAERGAKISRIVVRHWRVTQGYCGVLGLSLLGRG
jgi:hypothetical protein